MHQYIQDTEYATNGLVELICRDTGTLRELQDEQRNALEKEATFDLLFLQRQMHPSANYWHGQLVEAQKERSEIEKQIAYLEAQTLDLKQSLAALSGALLQIAKQGISSVKGRPDNCRSGRLVHGQELRWIIWAARNQALHFEEPKKVDDRTVAVLEGMKNDNGQSVLPGARDGNSLAFDVVNLLGWNSYAQYQSDMVELLG